MDNGESSYRRFLEGDKSAFEEIVLSYREGLTLFVERFTNDYEAAQDIAADVFTQLLIYPKRYNFKTKLKTYLYMMGRSRALDYIRRRNRIKMLPLSEDTEALGTKNLEDEVIEKERRQNLTREIDKLPEDMRTALYLIYFENLSYKDAAKIMKKNVKQIDNLVSKSKKILKSNLL